MARLPFCPRPQPALEADFGHSAKLGIFLLPLDLAGEPASQAPLTSGPPRTIDAFQPHHCSSRDRGLD
jgi:hypothetical protein